MFVFMYYLFWYFFKNRKLGKSVLILSDRWIVANLSHKKKYRGYFSWRLIGSKNAAFGTS